MVGQINRTPGQPAAYRQIEAQLAERIEDGELLPGMQLPSESDLVAGYGVARMTVRSAIRQLVGRGLVEARQGAGVFVKHRQVEPEPESAWERYVRAIRELRVAAGSPSIRDVAERTTASRAVVHGVFRCQRMPTIHALQAVVPALGGDVNTFERLWLDYQHERGDEPPPGEAVESAILDELRAIRELLERIAGPDPREVGRDLASRLDGLARPD